MPTHHAPRSVRPRAADRTQGGWTYPVLPAHLLEPAWELYVEAFAELRTTAAQRHVMYRSEFDEVMADPRVTK